MKLAALLSAFLMSVIVMAAPVRAQTVPTEAYQKCVASGQQSPECCEVQQGTEADCGQQFDIVKMIIPIIGIVLLAGGIIGAVIWERRRLS